MMRKRFVGSDEAVSGFPLVDMVIRQVDESRTLSAKTSSTPVGELEKLIEMKNRGDISEEEFQRLKSRIIPE